MILESITILDTETTSSVINLLDPDSRRLTGLLFPVLVGATTFTLKMSPNGTTFYPILDTAGSEVTYTISATGQCYVPIKEENSLGIKYFEIVMASAVDADRTIIPFGKYI